MFKVIGSNNTASLSFNNASYTMFQHIYWNLCCPRRQNSCYSCYWCVITGINWPRDWPACIAEAVLKQIRVEVIKTELYVLVSPGFSWRKTSLSQTVSFSFLPLSQNPHPLLGEGSLSVVILTTAALLLKHRLGWRKPVWWTWQIFLSFNANSATN